MRQELILPISCCTGECIGVVYIKKSSLYPTSFTPKYVQYSSLDYIRAIALLYVTIDVQTISHSLLGVSPFPLT